MPLLEEACAWLPTQQGLDIVVLLGHWDVSGLGATEETAVPGMYEYLRTIKGCDAYDQRGMLKSVMGHTHCNVAHPHGYTNVGFMVAGQGMEGCGNYGIPLLDTTDGRVRFYYFPIVSKLGVDTYDEVTSCLSASGWRQCTYLAELWLDESIEKA